MSRRGFDVQQSRKGLNIQHTYHVDEIHSPSAATRDHQTNVEPAPRTSPRPRSSIFGPYLIFRLTDSQMSRVTTLGSLRSYTLAKVLDKSSAPDIRLTVNKGEDPENVHSKCCWSLTSSCSQAVGHGGRCWTSNSGTPGRGLQHCRHRYMWGRGGRWESRRDTLDAQDACPEPQVGLSATTWIQKILAFQAEQSSDALKFNKFFPCLIPRLFQRGPALIDEAIAPDTKALSHQSRSLP